MKKNPQKLNVILSSYDYDSFSFFDENRKLSKKLLRDLEESMKIKDLQIPMTVNSKLQIIDGQHRFVVRKKLGFPLIYYIDDTVTSRDIGAINNITQKWSPENWLEHHVDIDENKDYKTFQWFVREYNFNISASLVLIYNSSSEGLRIFKEGNLKIKNFEDIKRKAKTLLKFYEDYGFEKYKHKTFIEAFNTLWINKKVDIKRLFKQLDRSSEWLNQQATKTQYIHLFQKILNKGVSGKNATILPTHIPKEVIQDAMDKGIRIDMSKVLY